MMRASIIAAPWGASTAALNLLADKLGQSLLDDFAPFSKGTMLITKIVDSFEKMQKGFEKVQ